LEYAQFGTINNGFGGRPYRYNYAATNELGWFLFDGLVKHDTLTGREESYQFEPGRVLQRGRRGSA
jgi:carotenoid cleavage dioxygenase